MGYTCVKMKIKSSFKSRKFKEERLLVDSGALYSVIPEKDTKELGIIAHSEEEFEMADGQLIKRKIGDAFFEFSGKRGASPVIFGKKDDACFLGVLTLEALGFMLDPLKRELKPLKKMLA